MERDTRNNLTAEQYIEGVSAGNRKLLGQAITLIESDSEAHQQKAQIVLKGLLPKTGQSIRVGVTGVPGAGKSTLIEALGCKLTKCGHKVAVMAVDPSSSITGGSILGDKTRMEDLARDRNAFIRPSPSGGTLGGVARKTRETMLLFEAAGYDVILVETVGVGQNEIAVRSLVDFFLLILIAGAGDELQGIKRGVMEIADAVLINKADGENIKTAELARDECRRALHYLIPATTGWQTSAFTSSATENAGVDEIWQVVEKFREVTTANGAFPSRRREQTRDWLHSMLREQLHDSFYRNEKIQALLPDLENQVMAGSLPATQAAWELLNAYSNRSD
jgi:LAO/AO transport system kinase